MIVMENAKQRSMQTISRHAEEHLEAIRRRKNDRWADNPLGSMFGADPYQQHYDKERIRIEQWRDDLFADDERKYAEAAQLLRSFHSFMRAGQACAQKGAEEVGSFKSAHLGDADKCLSSAVKAAEDLKKSGTIWYPVCHVWVYIWRSQVAFEMGQYFKAESEAKTALKMIRTNSLENDTHTFVSALERYAHGSRALNKINDAIKAFDSCYSKCASWAPDSARHYHCEASVPEQQALRRRHKSNGHVKSNGHARPRGVSVRQPSRRVRMRKSSAASQKRRVGCARRRRSDVLRPRTSCAARAEDGRR